MIDFLAQLPVVELLTRAVATALIIVVVATAVGKLGPVAGGLVAGLPIGLGPGFYFLLDTGSTEFLGQVATYALLALSATQVFLTSYMATARHGFPRMSLSLAACSWWGTIWLLNALPVTTLLAAFLFIAMTIVTRFVGRRFQIPNAITERREESFMLLMRAVIGGFLVALVTVFAPLLGAGLSGILLAFPIGYALISLTIHAQFGAATVVGVVFSALLGTISLATFCIVFVIALPGLSPVKALIVGLTASVVVTASMMLISRVSGAPEQQEKTGA